MTQKKLPLINSAHGSETRNIINELIKLFNDMGYTYNESLQKAQDILDEAKTTNDMNESVQQQINTLIAESGTSDAEVLQARVDAEGNEYQVLKERLDEKEQKFSTQLAHTEEKLNVYDWELNSKHRHKKGITVFVSDDGAISEYTKMKPIFEAEGVPFCIAVPSAWVGRPNYMTREQLLEVQNELGWEILAHSVDHPYNPVIKDMPDAQAEAQFRDSKLQLRAMGLEVNNMAYVGGNYGKRERMFARKYYRAARSSDYGDDALNLPPIESAELKTFWIDTTAGFLTTYLNDTSLTRAEAITKTLNLVKSHINYARDKNAIFIISTHTNEINEPDLLDLWQEVIRYAKQETEVMTLNDALNQMGNLIEVGDYSKLGSRAPGGQRFVVGVDGTIDGSATVVEPNRFTPSSRYAEFQFGVSYCPVNTSHASQAPEKAAGLLVNYKVNDIDVGFNYQEYHIFGTRRMYKRRVRGDKTFTAWEPLTEFAIDSAQTYNPSTSYANLPSGVTYSAVSYNTATQTGAPVASAGYLITYKMNGLDYQEYRSVPGSVMRNFYVRNIQGGVLGDWKIFTPGMWMPDNNNFTAATPFSTFPLGITYSIIQGDNPDLASSPEGENGTLITHKFTTTSVYGYNFQEYHVFNSPTGETYKRYATGTTSWGPWIKTSVG